MPQGGEIISLYIGQAGCQIGGACWELLCLEHGIRPDGIYCGPRYPDEFHPDIFFDSTGSNKVVPRVAFIDLEPTCIDEIRTGRFRQLFSPQCLVSGKEDAANCFARGYITLAKGIIDLTLNRIARIAEKCSRLQGFLIFCASGGGTGSGLMARILERIHQDYPKTCILKFPVHPCPTISPIIVEPYNTALGIHHTLEHASGTFVMDNEAAYDMCSRLLDVRSPSYPHINRLVAQVIANLTSSLRYSSTVNVNLLEMSTNLIPYPRVSHGLISYAPIVSRRRVIYENVTENALLNSCFEMANQFVKCDVTKGKYMACTILFRGNVSNASVNAAAASIKAKKSIRFVEWCPTNFKVGISNVPPIVLPAGDLAETPQVCLMLSNSTAVRSIWPRLNRKFDMLLSKKAFLHWYIQEGLEEGDFQETRLDLGALESDYLEIESNQ